jgi:glycosyltransferase involved in cell wall biosynthesis
MAKVTIAIPTYNRPEFLTQSIQSVLGQTFQDFKIVIFDDGSDFFYPDFLKQFNDPRIEVRTAEKDGRGNLSNFRRIYNCQYDTDYLVIFHDDDCMHPRMLEKEVAVLESNANLVWVGTDLNFVKNYKKMNMFTKSPGSSARVKTMDAQEAVREILRGFNLCFDSVMYRTKHLTDASELQTRFDKWFDRPYLISLIKTNRAAVIKQKLVNYRLHTGQDSAAKTANMDYTEYSKRLFRFYFSCLPRPLSAKDTKLFNAFVSNNALSLALAESHNWNEFKKSLAGLRKEGYFSLGAVNLKGYYYSAKLLLRKFYAGK